jgi:glycosidase
MPLSMKLVFGHLTIAMPMAVGDFPRLDSEIGLLEDLGINTIWLLPFFPSPQR